MGTGRPSSRLQRSLPQSESLKKGIETEGFAAERECTGAASDVEPIDPRSPERNSANSDTAAAFVAWSSAVCGVCAAKRTLVGERRRANDGPKHYRQAARDDAGRSLSDEFVAQPPHPAFDHCSRQARKPMTSSKTSADVIGSRKWSWVLLMSRSFTTSNISTDMSAPNRRWTPETAAAATRLRQYAALANPKVPEVLTHTPFPSSFLRQARCQSSVAVG